MTTTALTLSAFALREHEGFVCVYDLSFALERHLPRASHYRKHPAARFAAWREFTEVTQNPSTAF